MPRRTLATSPARIASRERQAQAVHLRRHGFSYQRIADTLGYGSKASAYKAVRTALDEVVRESAYDLLALETERLNYMLTRIWPQVEQGDLHAVDRALKILTEEAKLYGLYDLPIPGGRGTYRAEVLPDIDPMARARFYETLRALFVATPEA